MPQRLELRQGQRANSENASTPSAPPHDAPDFERTERIGEFWTYPQSHAIGELLID